MSSAEIRGLHENESGAAMTGALLLLMAAGFVLAKTMLFSGSPVVTHGEVACDVIAVMMTVLAIVISVGRGVS